MDGRKEIQTCIKEKEKGGKHSPAFLRHMGSGLYAETRCRKVYAGQVFEEQIISMEAKKTFGDGGSRNYANS